MHAEGIPLAGGNTAPVVRLGGTVRRVAGPWTPTVQMFMQALRDNGVPYVPAPLGVDDEGREVVEYVTGDCPIYPLPDWAWTDDALTQVARALRAMHDAAPASAHPATGWRREPLDPAEVVCHSDVAPYNSVWRDGTLVAFIDWDHARPAPRGWDFGYAAHRFVSLTAPTNAEGRPGDEREQRRRLALFCATYGGFDPADALRWALTRVEDLIANNGPHRPIYEADAAWLRTL